ncbi:MAG TPA: hypothetical protein VLG91_03440 [Streptomyces sp.]|nr:hypothetical protein [Streptomyces sp.]
MTDYDLELSRYLRQRQEQRRSDAKELLSRLTPREWSLVRDAAVMGYVLGTVERPERHDFPTDTDILHRVTYAVTREDTNYLVLRGIIDQYTPANEEDKS